MKRPKIDPLILAISLAKIEAMSQIKTRPATYSAVDFATSVAGYEFAYELETKQAATKRQKDMAFKRFCKAVKYTMKQLPFHD